jgi:hypothetical protein
VRLVAAATLAVLASATVGRADPTGPHPRILLDPSLRAAWRGQADAAHGPVKGAIALCEDARTTPEHEHALYQGAEWAKVLQACLVAYAATDSKDDAATALRYFQALLDDLDTVGDHRGGATAARRDDGYAIRNLGPWTALAYDWLHDAPGMTPELRARARARWKAWLAWYSEHGYRAHNAATNYHAGYVIAATMIAIAEAGEAGDDSAALWRDVSETMWKKEIAGVLADGAPLDGGDWPEGWQYGPLSVAEYSLGARVMKRAGVDVPGVQRWLGALLERHVHALSPGGGVYAGGDTEAETPNLGPSVLTLDAVALGDATPDDRRWARGELSRLGLADADYLLYDALAGVGDRPVQPPRAKWPTWYVTTGTGTLFARTRWDDHAVWFVTTCHGGIEVDHRHLDAGNFVLSRGKDDVIVDPSPYGSQSTLTGNAPTVASAQLPKEYIPSQAPWGQKTRFDFATQRASGVVVARCDYADVYTFQEHKSDVPDALRSLVLLPDHDGTSAVLVVVDRADTGDPGRGINLRFRANGHLALAGTNATATIGGTKLAITGLDDKPVIGAPSAKDCFAPGTVRGTCDAARFPVTDYRVTLPGPRPFAVHAISVTDGKGAAPTLAALSGDGWQGVRVGGVRDAVVVWRTSKGELAYKAPAATAMTHVVMDAPDQGGMVSIAAHRDGDACAVQVTPGGSLPARPLVVTLDAQCNVTSDPEAGAGSAIALRPVTKAEVRSPRAGCCGAQTTPGSPIAMTVVVGVIVLRRRRKR